VIDAPSSYELRECELVEAGPRTALWRITAHTSLPQDGRASCVLINDGRAHSRLSPLPAPPDPSGLLRFAFSAGQRL